MIYPCWPRDICQTQWESIGIRTCFYQVSSSNHPHGSRAVRVRREQRKGECCWDMFQSVRLGPGMCQLAAPGFMVSAVHQRKSHAMILCSFTLKQVPNRRRIQTTQTAKIPPSLLPRYGGRRLTLGQNQRDFWIFIFCSLVFWYTNVFYIFCTYQCSYEFIDKSIIFYMFLCSCKINENKL